MTSEQQEFEDAVRAEGPIVTADLRTSNWAAQYRDNTLVQAAGTLGKLADQPPLIAGSGAVALAGLAIGDRHLARAGLRMLGSHLLATGIKTVLKNNVDRPRPEKAIEEGEHHFEPGHSDDGEERSFPSGHTAGALAVSRALVREYPGAAGPAYLAAATAALAQVPKRAHFASDVVVGAAIGLAAEAIVALAIDRLRGLARP